MYEYTFNERLMGTDLSVSLIMDDEVRATELFVLTLGRLRIYEERFSRFCEESELSRLNRERTMVVSPLMCTLLKTARVLYQKTEGYFNPLLQVDRLGYHESFEHMTGAQFQNLLPYNTNMNTLSIDESTHEVRLVDDQMLDFGGFLKGYLAENEAKRIMYENSNVYGVIVNIGGDLHTRGKDEHDNVFVFDIHNPLEGNNIAVPLENMSLATSGTYKRAWDTEHAHVHHILDRGGVKNPTSDIISASVIHQSGAAAEAYAKTLLSVHPETLSVMIDESIQCILIHNDGTIYTSL